MNDSVQNALPLQIDLTVTGVSLGNPDGTWRVHVRDTSSRKWRPVGYFEVNEGKGTFIIDFKDTISFDAYVCTRHSGGEYSGRSRETLDKLTYRVYP